MTYGQIADIIAERHGKAKMSAQAVGGAVGHNPISVIIPCHRVVTRNGEVSKAFAFGGENMQRILLSEEGIEFLDDGRIDLSRYFWNGDTI